LCIDGNFSHAIGYWYAIGDRRWRLEEPTSPNLKVEGQSIPKVTNCDVIIISK